MVVLTDRNNEAHAALLGDASKALRIPSARDRRWSGVACKEKSGAIVPLASAAMT
jgi:hypothetical protein